MAIFMGFTSGLPNSVCQPSALGKVVRSSASPYCVEPPLENAYLEKTGEARTRGTSGAASMRKGLPPVFLDSNESVMGTSTVGMVVTPPRAGDRKSVVEG